VDDASGIAGTARFIHKSQREHIVSLDAPAFAAAEGLAKGKIPRDHTVAQTCERAAARLGIDGFNPGELRHSFATFRHGASARSPEIATARPPPPCALDQCTVNQRPPPPSAAPSHRAAGGERDPPLGGLQCLQPPHGSDSRRLRTALAMAMVTARTATIVSETGRSSD